MLSKAEETKYGRIVTPDHSAGGMGIAVLLFHHQSHGASLRTKHISTGGGSEWENCPLEAPIFHFSFGKKKCGPLRKRLTKERRVALSVKLLSSQ
jgi:hypothetical protein